MKLAWIQAGQIVTTHGIKGEVKVMPWLDGPEDLKHYTRCRIGGKDYTIQSCRVQKTCDLVKLSGVDTPEAGAALKDQVLELRREDAPEGAVFAAELIGMSVFCEGKLLGKITDVLDYPGNQVYEITGEHSWLLPAVKQFVHSIDLAADRMEVSVIEGMRSDEN